MHTIWLSWKLIALAVMQVVAENMEHFVWQQKQKLKKVIVNE